MNSSPWLLHLCQAHAFHCSFMTIANNSFQSLSLLSLFHHFHIKQMNQNFNPSSVGPHRLPWDQHQPEVSNREYSQLLRLTQPDSSKHTIYINRSISASWESHFTNPFDGQQKWQLEKGTQHEKYIPSSYNMMKYPGDAREPQVDNFSLVLDEVRKISTTFLRVLNGLRGRLENNRGNNLGVNH